MAELSWPEIEVFVKRWGLIVLGVVILIIAVVLISRSGSSPSKLCSNEPIRITFDKLSNCRSEKAIAALQVTNEIVIKGCFLESLISIFSKKSCPTNTNLLATQSPSFDSKLTNPNTVCSYCGQPFVAGGNPSRYPSSSIPNCRNPTSTTLTSLVNETAYSASDYGMSLKKSKAAKKNT